MGRQRPNKLLVKVAVDQAHLTFGFAGLCFQIIKLLADVGGRGAVQNRQIADKAISFILFYLLGAQQRHRCLLSFE